MLTSAQGLKGTIVTPMHYAPIPKGHISAAARKVMKAMVVAVRQVSSQTLLMTPDL